MVRTNQGGSILGFVVLGGIMALLLIGGAYIVRRNFPPAEIGSEIAVSDERGESSNQSDENKPSTPAPNDNQEGEGSSPKPSTVPGGVNNNTDSSNQTVTPTEKSPAVDSQNSSGLPETGPSSVVFAGLMLSGLSGLLVAYIQSRRTRHLFDFSVR